MKIKELFFSLCMLITSFSFAGNKVTNNNTCKINKSHQMQPLMRLTLQTSCGYQVSFDYTCDGCNIYNVVGDLTMLQEYYEQELCPQVIEYTV